MTTGGRGAYEVGPYRILRPLAKGGMAEVYEVEDLASGEHLALKVLMQTGGALPRFNREYEAMIRLNHPNIVRVYAYGLMGEYPWISMELIEGTPIQAYAKHWGKPGSVERTHGVCRAAHDLALALDHIHRRGLVHRDLKSANVLVLPDGRVKLIDFGTARVTDPVDDITREGEFIGTFAYASPEQLQNLPIDGRSDLYSLGVLLYRLVTGRRPFETDDIGELARLHIRVDPDPPSKWVPELPPDFELLILRLLAKDPERRMQTGAEVADALERLMGSELTATGGLATEMSLETLVGREDQMRTLWGFFEGQADRQGLEKGHQPGDMALIVGLHGSGRHHVVQEMDRHARQLGWTAMTLFFRKGADDLDQVAHMANQLVRSFGPNPPTAAAGAAEIVRRVERSPLLPAAERLGALRGAAAQLLQARAEVDAVPIVLFVRGLQHAGSLGFEALVALRDAVRDLSARVLFVADMNENADHPGSLVRQRLQDVLRITLPPLTVRQVALLVGAYLHRRPPPTAVARKIFDASGGLPAYVEDVTKRLVAEGLLRTQGHDQNRIDWAQKVDVAIPVPDDAFERLTDELASLPADRRRCLETLALCGGEGAASMLAAALDCAGPELAPALRDLEHRGWITLSRSGTDPYARWRQLLAQDFVLEQLHPCRRRVLERKVVDIVAGEPPFVAQIRLLVTAGRLDEAYLRARDWAAYQLIKHRPLSALEALDRVMPELERAGAEGLLAAELWLLNATALLGARPTDPRLARALERAARLFQDVEDKDLYEAEVHYLRAQVHQVIGHYPMFEASLDQAWRIVEEAPADPLGASIATMLGWSTQTKGQVQEAATWYGRARRIAGLANAPAAKANADVGVASWQLAQGHLNEAEKTVFSVLPTLQDAEDLRGLSVAIPILAESLGLQGKFSDALKLMELQLPVMRECEVPTFYVRLLLGAASTETLLGRLGRAQEHVDELGANLRLGEHLELRLRADLVWGRIQVASELYEDAVRKLKAVEDRARSCGLGVIAESALASRAEALWALGDHSESVTGFKRALDALAKMGDLPALAQASFCQARAVCDKIDPDNALVRVAEWLDQPQSVVGQIEREIARGRYERSRGLPGLALERAQRMIDRVASGLEETDASALRLHPWTQHIRRARIGRRTLTGS